MQKLSYCNNAQIPCLKYANHIGESLTTKKSSYVFSSENTENTLEEIYALKKEGMRYYNACLSQS